MVHHLQYNCQWCFDQHQVTQRKSLLGKKSPDLAIGAKAFRWPP
jgi:hypothetical protein